MLCVGFPVQYKIFQTRSLLRGRPVAATSFPEVDHSALRAIAKRDSSIEFYLRYGQTASASMAFRASISIVVGSALRDECERCGDGHTTAAKGTDQAREDPARPPGHRPKDQGAAKIALPPPLQRERGSRGPRQLSPHFRSFGARQAADFNRMPSGALGRRRARSRPARPAVAPLTDRLAAP